MSIFNLTVKFHFAASHFLTDYHGECEHMHGHNYKLEVKIKGEVQKDGMVIDYKEIKKVVNENVIDHLDHKHLNDVIDNPSSENLCKWIWEKLEGKIPLVKITLHETDNYYCEYEGK